MTKVVVPLAALPHLPNDVCASSGTRAEGTVKANVPRRLPWWLVPLVFVPGGLLPLVLLALTGGTRFDVPASRETIRRRRAGVAGVGVGGIALPFAMAVPLLSPNVLTVAASILAVAGFVGAVRLYRASSVGLHRIAGDQVKIHRVHPSYAAAVRAALEPRAAAPAIPAGWYADPAGTPLLRWWDGGAWTVHVHGAAPAT